jgi:hypothetical protein
MSKRQIKNVQKYTGIHVNGEDDRGTCLARTDGVGLTALSALSISTQLGKSQVAVCQAFEYYVVTLTRSQLPAARTAGAAWSALS